MAKKGARNFRKEETLPAFYHLPVYTHASSFFSYNMVNYDKWSKLANTLHADTDSEEEEELRRFTQKTSHYIHIPAKEYSTKEQLCALLEEVPDFTNQVGEKRFGWKCAGSGAVPGYNASNPKTSDLWRLHYDDMFLTSQTTPNPGARALLGTTSLGSMVVSCHAKGKGGRAISRKEVSDLIFNRQQGKDAEGIHLEQEAYGERMEEMKKMGINPIEMK